jgi:hypothetical protein
MVVLISLGAVALLMFLIAFHLALLLTWTYNETIKLQDVFSLHPISETQNTKMPYTE